MSLIREEQPFINDDDTNHRLSRYVSNGLTGVQAGRDADRHVYGDHIEINE